mgnify:CR=1 FL=1
MIHADKIPNLPWQDRKEGSSDIIWRYDNNPIIDKSFIPTANSIFNSAVVYRGGHFEGVFRCDNIEMQQNLYLGISDDGIHWDIEPTPLNLYKPDTDEIIGQARGYDPRVCLIDGRYIVTWCNNYYGPTIGIAYSTDFRKFYQLENAFLPFNRNGVMFPRKIGGKYCMMSRPSDNGHTPFGDIFLSQSPDLEHWGYHRHVMGAGGGWSWTKIGAGPIPIETDEGWLLIYHGVATTCSGMIYSMGGAILDLEHPWEVKYRCKPYIMHPEEIYERVGDVPNVVFPCAMLCDGETGRLAIYYGAADTVVGLAFAHIDEIMDYIKKNSD